MEPAVFLIGDNSGELDALKEVLEAAEICVRLYESAENFLLALSPGFRGCLLLDAQLPGLSGLELQSELNTISCGLPVIFLADPKGSGWMLVDACKAGAFDVIAKLVEAQALLRCVACALAFEREQHAAKGLAGQSLARIGRLTNREREIMCEVLAGRSSKEIARRLGVSHRTVEVHRAHIMQKTGSHNVLDLARLSELSKSPLRGEPSES